jgi:hypothetical protein
MWTNKKAKVFYISVYCHVTCHIFASYWSIYLENAVIYQRRSGILERAIIPQHGE